MRRFPLTGRRRFRLIWFLGVAILPVGIGLGGWWMVFVAGALVGWMIPRPRRVLPAGAVVGLVTWGLPLLWEQIQYGLRPTATSLAAIMGLNGAATIPLALTLLVGALLGLTGAWLGCAARGLYAHLRPLSPVEELLDQQLKMVDPVLAKR